jgi:hypothetical protein
MTTRKQRPARVFALQYVPMQHVFWLLPGRLAGRPGPDQAPWTLSALRDAGFGAVVSVNAGALCEPTAFDALGMAYGCFPLSDWVPPQPGDREVCLRMLPQAYAFVHTQLQHGRQVLVHCGGSDDPTGLFLSYFLIRQTGVAPGTAIATVRAVRPTALSAEGWEDFALQVLKASA